MVFVGKFAHFANANPSTLENFRKFEAQELNSSCTARMVRYLTGRTSYKVFLKFAMSQKLKGEELRALYGDLLKGNGDSEWEEPTELLRALEKLTSPSSFRTFIEGKGSDIELLADILYLPRRTLPWLQRFIMKQLISSDLSPSESLKAVRLLRQRNINFMIYPPRYGSNGVWCLGELARKFASNTNGIAEIERAIEDEAIAATRELPSQKIKVGDFLRTKGGDYKVRASFIKKMSDTLNSEVREFYKDDTLDSSTAKSDIKETLVTLKAHAKGVLSTKEFLEQHEKKPFKGFALGVNGSGYQYQGLAQHLGLMHYSDAYKHFWKSENMEGLSPGQQKTKTDRLMKKMIASGKDIVFFVPDTLKKTHFTRMEYEYLVSLPKTHLKNVTFVFGAYKDGFDNEIRNELYND